MNKIKTTQDVLIRGIRKDTLIRIDERASKLNMDRNTYLKFFLDNMELEARTNERISILVELIQEATEQIKRNNELLDKIKGKV